MTTCHHAMKFKRQPKKRRWHSPVSVTKIYESSEKSDSAPVFVAHYDPDRGIIDSWDVSTRDIGRPLTGGKSVRTLTMGKNGFYTPVVRYESIANLAGSNLLPRSDCPPDLAYLWPVAGSLPNTAIQIPSRLLMAEALTVIPRARDSVPLDRLRRYEDKNLDFLIATKVRPIKLSLNSGFSLINFLLQWRDVVHIFSHYLTNKGLRGRLRKLFHYEKGLDGTAKALADEVLEHNYGTAQFFRDSHTIFQIMQDWRKHADRLYAEAGLLRNKNYLLEPEVRLQVQSLAGPNRSLDILPGSIFRMEETVTLRMRATLVYSYTMPHMIRFLSRLGQLCDSYGVSLDPSIIWDTIPFTFVIDWFYNVGEWLHRQRLDWTQAEVTYKQFGVSSKLTSTRAFYLDQPSGPDGSIQTLPVGSLVYRYYERALRAKLPPGTEPSLDNSERWSLTKISNATALGVQQLLRQKHIRVSHPLVPKHR